MRFAAARTASKRNEKGGKQHDDASFIPAIERRRRGLGDQRWPARADNAPGITDTEIKIGQTMPYSGPASAYGVIGSTEAAYFKMINEQGGVNGRKINLISLDDAYSPPKTVEQMRRLVEQEQVAFIFQTLGTPPNARDPAIPQRQQGAAAIRLDRRGVFSDPAAFPWTIGFNPNYQTEAQIYGKHILKTKPDAQDRRPLPKRWLRQRLSDRSQGRAWRSRRHDREGSVL